MKMKLFKLILSFLPCLFIFILTSCDKDDILDGSDLYKTIDLGLSVKWATCNIGAASPEDFGEYFAWGEVAPKNVYTRGNSKTYGKAMNCISANATYDAARANWGDGWRVPTKDEMQELKANCTWRWTTVNGVNGYKVSSKKNNNFIFLPAGGYRSDSYLKKSNDFCFYWTSTPRYEEYRQYNAYYLNNNSGSPYIDDSNRYYGLCIRPVKR